MQLTKGAIGNLINRYKAVLKKCHLLNVFGSLAVAGMLVMGGAGVAGAAENTQPVVTISSFNAYNGTDATLSAGSGSKNIFVGGTINNIESLDPHTHFGTFTDPTSITVTGGTYNWDIYAGSLAVANGSTEGFKETSATSGSTKLVINGGTFEGAELAGGGSASTTGTGVASVTVQGDTSVTINSYTHTGDGLDYIMAGNKVLAGGGAATGKITGNTNLIIDPAGEKNVTTTAVVLGGSGVRVFNGADTKASDTINGNTNVTINGGTLAGVVGGSLAEVLSGTGSATATVEGNSTVTINGGTIDQIKFGSNTTPGITADPSVVGGSMAYGDGAVALNKGNTLVTINGGTINDKVLGGSLAQKGGAVTLGTEDAHVTSGIVVKNVSKVGDLVGGNMAEGGTATLHGDSYVVVEAGKVEGDVMGGSYVRGSGTVTTTGNTGVVFNADNNATVNQAEYLVGGDKVLASSEDAQSTGTISGTSSVTVNGNASVTTGAVVGGSFSRVLAGTDDRAASATVANSVVTINDGQSIAGVVGGGLAEHLSGNGSATSTVTGTSAVYVNGGNLTNIVYTKGSSGKASSYAAVAGAGLATGENATASVGNSVVVIDGDDTVIKGNQPDTGKTGYFDKDNAKVVAGGVAINGGTVSVANTSLTMKNGTVTGDLVGGNLIDGEGTAGNITSTSVALTGGTLDGEVMGGSYVRGTNSSNIGTTNVLVSGGELQSVDHKAQYVLGGGKALVYADDQEASLTIDTTNVTISDSVKVLGGGVIGGSLAKGTGTGKATVSVTKANTTILGGTEIAGVVGGGVAENYGTATGEVSSSVTESQLTISGGTIDALRYGAQISDDGETASKAAVVGGGVASAKGTGTITSNVTTANTTINGGTINGNVFAGGMADGTSATANVTNANLTISGNAEINGNIHAGGYALNGGTATVKNATVTFDGNSSFAGKVFGQGHDATNSNKATVNNSTLAFTNYTGEFKGLVVGFTNLDVAEGSTLQLGTLSTGEAGEGDTAGVFNNNALTLTGAGNVVAANVDVVADKSLTIQNGTLTVTESLKSAEAGNGTEGINVSDNGVLSAANNLLVTNTDGTIAIADDLNKLYLENGGTLAVTGLGGISTADMQGYYSALVADGSTGLIKYEGATIEVSATDQTGSGNLKGSVAEGTGALLTGTTVEYDGTTNSTTINGGYGADTVLISSAAAGDHTVTLDGNLTLLGDGENLITVTGGEGASLSKVTVNAGNALNLGSAAAPSQGGDLGADVKLGDGSSLNAVAGDYTVGAVKGTADKQGTVSSSAGGSLVAESIGEGNNARVAAVNASQGSIHSTGVIRTDKLTIDGGVVSSGRTISVLQAVENMNGTLTAESTISLNGGATNAQGQIVTGGNLNLKGDITKAADGTLDIIVDKAIQASGKNIEATNVVAKSMDAKAVSVEGGSLLLADASTVESLKLTNGTQAVIEGSLKLDGTDKTLTVGTGDDTVGGTTLSAKHIDLNDGMLLVDPAWGQASSNVAVASMGTPSSTTDVVLNGNVGVGQNSYLALGTKDTGWLPGVVAGYTKGVGLSETGVTAALGLYEGITIGTDMGLRVDGSKTSADLAAQFGPSVLASKNKAVFANNSLLVVNGQNIYGDTAAISFENNAGTLKVGQDAKLLVTDAVDGQNYTIVDNVTTVKDGAGNPVVTDGIVWNDAATTSDMISLGEVKFDGTDKVTTTAVRNDAHTVFPNLSDGMADAVNDLYTGHDGAAGEPRWDYADVNSADMGVRFLSRATDNRFLGSDKDAAAATIESAARIAFAGAVPQMTKMASEAGTNAVVNRLGFANPADGAQAMDAEGKIVDRNTTGFALWIAPLWQNQHGWGMEADSMDYGFNGNLGGVSLGADYTFENALRAGITFNIGGGYAESSGGDLSSTDNRMNFWGLGAYAGWNYENFGIMADISYTSTWNQLKQDVDSRMGMGDLEADVQASAISAGLRAEYLLQTSALDIIPHIGVRYMSLNTWGFDAESNGGTVLEGDGFHQDIWTFPIGVTLSKDIALDNGFTFKPSVDFSVIPAAGDIKAKQDVAFTGLPGTYEVETQMMDYLTWQGGVGLELGNDTMSFGVNYTLQAGQHSTGHGLFGSFRYEF